MFQVNPLLGRGFTWKIKPYFLQKIKVKKLKCRLLQFLFGALRVKYWSYLLENNKHLFLVKQPAVSRFPVLHTDFIIEHMTHCNQKLAEKHQIIMNLAEFYVESHVYVGFIQYIYGVTKHMQNCWRIRVNVFYWSECNSAEQRPIMWNHLYLKLNSFYEIWYHKNVKLHSRKLFVLFVFLVGLLL